MNIFDELIEKGRKTPIGEKLYNILLGFCEDKGVIALALNQLETDKKKQRMIDYIEKYNIETDEDVDSLIDCIEENREPEIISE